ncbi:VPLPA-CTERM sorting domain-containing protein [Lutimaribacter saemankumensis]|uniref:VPLPA-CTERM sorting domain-containing protein n=1 Tax=Lutimaribacter saemankumensis TaxID=490829 RepID=UPI000B7EBEE6|nr:VPLPA-CTERM sorting domain-containing protein [Lutimaribacter saemankumensis]
MKLKALAAAAALLVSAPVHAATINHVISMGTTGSPNPAVLDITLDTDLLATGSGQSAGLTINSINFAVDGSVLYENPFGVNTILLYGSIGGVAASFGTNDFYVRLENFATTFATAWGPSIVQGSFIDDGSASVTSRDISGVVPLPAGVIFLATGIGALGLTRRRKSKLT